jgi:hypothetical protein
MYLDAEIASEASAASKEVKALTHIHDPHKAADATGDISFALGRLQALIEIRTKELDTTSTTRLTWRIGRVLHPPRSTNDPPWKEMSKRERLCRRFRELRRPQTSASGDPLKEQGMRPGL